jgi:hypothetical protein
MAARRYRDGGAYGEAADGGRSNPDVAAELGLTRSTVEWHLWRVYASSERTRGPSLRGVQNGRFRPIGMEQLWNRGGATGRKRSARQTPINGLNERETVATGCHRLPFGSHGKEGVSGSSPEEGSAKAPQNGAFSIA